MQREKILILATIICSSLVLGLSGIPALADSHSGRHWMGGNDSDQKANTEAGDRSNRSDHSSNNRSDSRTNSRSHQDRHRDRGPFNFEKRDPQRPGKHSATPLYTGDDHGYQRPGKDSGGRKDRGASPNRPESPTPRQQVPHQQTPHQQTPPNQQRGEHKHDTSHDKHLPIAPHPEHRPDGRHNAHRPDKGAVHSRPGDNNRGHNPRYYPPHYYPPHYYKPGHRPNYHLYNRHKYIYYRTPWYNTWFLAPIFWPYYPIGYEVAFLPTPYMRIVVGGYPYYYYSGTFYRPYGSVYVVVNAPVGAMVTSLPPGYIAFILGDTTYYFVNDTYYVWDQTRDGFVVVAKPEGAESAMEKATQGRLYVYPNEGQSEEQQAKDRYACHLWAVSESDVDPTLEDQVFTDKQQSDYKRAITACLEGRGYTVK